MKPELKIVGATPEAEITVQTKSWADQKPYEMDDTKRPRHMFEEAETFRPAVKGYALARLKMMTGGWVAGKAAQSAQFWFQSYHHIQAQYLIIYNFYEGRGTHMAELYLTVDCSHPTARQLVKDGCALDLLTVEKPVGGTKKVVWPTTRFLRFFENGVMGHIKQVRDGVGRDYNVDDLISGYDSYITGVDMWVRENGHNEGFVFMREK
tara:strand:- start:167 stop:790 length:624 start_codon:yes stop_codon:yes gene_type:complete